MSGRKVKIRERGNPEGEGRFDVILPSGEFVSLWYDSEPTRRSIKNYFTRDQGRGVAIAIAVQFEERRLPIPPGE